MLDLAFIVLLTAWAAGVGLRGLRGFGVELDRKCPVDILALALPLGLGALAMATLGLGELGRLSAPGLGVVLGLGLVAGVGPLLGWVRDARRAESARRAALLQGGWPTRTWVDRAFDMALAATVLGTLLTALAPVTDGDALCYHLQVPKVFLAQHGVFFDPDLHETVYPLVTEMLYAVALAMRGPVACRLVQWVLGLAFAAGVTALARPVLGPRARWAGTIAMLVPAVSNGMSAPLNDVALAAFAGAAILAWTRWLDEPSGRSAGLAGLMLGLALGAKYPALVLMGLLGPAMLARAVARRDRAMLVQAAAFGGVAVLVGGCWYLRASLHTGNPVYPFFRNTFGAGIDAVLDPTRKRMRVSALNLLTALGPMTLQPARFDSLAHQFGPAFLLFLPGLLLARKVPRRVWLLAGLGYAFVTVCMSQRQSMRFVLTAVGPMSVAVAWLACDWWQRRSVPGRVLVMLVLLMLGFEASLALVRARHGMGVVLGRESAESYLTRREPTFRVARWVGQNLPASARLIGQDHRGFYFPRTYTMELAHRRRTGLGTRGEPAGLIVARLRDEGFTHLLLCPPVPETAVEFDPTLGRQLAPWLADCKPIYRADIADPDGVVRRYSLYELADGPLATATGPGGARR